MTVRSPHERPGGTPGRPAAVQEPLRELCVPGARQTTPRRHCEARPRRGARHEKKAARTARGGLAGFSVLEAGMNDQSKAGGSSTWSTAVVSSRPSATAFGLRTRF